MRVTSIQPFVDADLHDLRHVHPTLRPAVDGVRLAVIAMYPTGFDGHLTWTTAFSIHRKRKSFSLARHEIPMWGLTVTSPGANPVTLLTTRWMTGDGEHYYRAFHNGVMDRDLAPARFPALYAAMHEAFHPIVDMALRNPFFISEVITRINGALGFPSTKKPVLGTDGLYSVFVATALSPVAARNLAELLVEGMIEYHSLGEEAGALAKAVGITVDRYFRRDAPGATQALALHTDRVRRFVTGQIGFVPVFANEEIAAWERTYQEFAAAVATGSELPESSFRALDFYACDFFLDLEKLVPTPAGSRAFALRRDSGEESAIKNAAPDFRFSFNGTSVSYTVANPALLREIDSDQLSRLVTGRDKFFAYIQGEARDIVREYPEIADGSAGLSQAAKSSMLKVLRAYLSDIDTPGPSR